MQIARDLFEREAVRLAEREHDCVFDRRRLQLEVELPAEALAQRQAPRAIDAVAERRMDDQLHAAGFVEETLEHDFFLRRHDTEHAFGGGEIVDDLLGGAGARAVRLREPFAGVL